MQEIHKFKNWLSENIYHTKNCKKEPIDIGTLNYGFKYLKNGQNISDPMHLYLKPLSSGCNKSSTSLKFNISGEQLCDTKVQFIKRLQYTPFYYSYLSGDGYTINIVDFYDWETNIVFRILLLKSFNKLDTIEIECPNIIQDKSIKIQESYFKCTHTTKKLPKEDKLIINFNTDEHYESLIIFAFSKDKEINKELSFTSTYKQLKHLHIKCRQNHISNHFVTKCITTEYELDTLWTTQKYITPDHKPDSMILNNHVKYSAEINWIVELYIYLGWKKDLSQIWSLLKSVVSIENLSWRLLFLVHLMESYLNIDSEEQISKDLFNHMKNTEVSDPECIFRYLCDRYIGKNKKSSLPKTNQCDEKLIYSGYFGGDIPDIELTNNLQHWWDLNSLPIFSQKLNKSIKQGDEINFLIYLLSLRQRLPWSENLYNLFVKNDKNQFFQLLFFLHQRLVLKNDLSNKLMIYPGYTWDNNYKSLLIPENEISISFTKYSKKNYLTLRDKKNIILKIDREVNLIYNKEKNKFIINPSIPYFYSDIENIKTIQVSIKNKILVFPMIWRKGELFFSGIKIRWILKKRRVQVTFVTKDHGENLYIDDNKIDFKNSFKYKHYIDIELKQPRFEVNVLDPLNRNLHLRQRSGKKNIHVTGWALDKQGVFIQYFNYKFSSKQHPVIINDSGLIAKTITVPSDVRKFSILFKHFKKQIAFREFNDIFIEKLFRFCPECWKCDMIVLVDIILKDQMKIIIPLIESILGFSPEFSFNQRLIQRSDTSIVIFLTSLINSINVVSNDSMKKKEYLEIGTKNGFDNLKKLVPFLEQNFLKNI